MYIDKFAQIIEKNKWNNISRHCNLEEQERTKYGIRKNTTLCKNGRKKSCRRTVSSLSGNHDGLALEVLR